MEEKESKDSLRNVVLRRDSKEGTNATDKNLMASKRTFICWVILIGTGRFWNGRIRGRRGIILIVRVLRRWWTTISIVVALHVALIIGTWTRIIV